MPPNRNDATAVGDYPPPQTHSISPLRISLVFSVAYFAICTLYIWLSSLMAARLSTSIEDLQRIETIKGISFIFLTTVSIFLILFFLFKRLSMDERKIIDQQQQLIKSRQEATAGIFASSIAHDINNILIVLDHYCSLLREDYSESGYTETREKVQNAIGELKSLAQRLMNIGRGNLPHQFSNFNLPQLIRDTIKLIRKHKAVHGITLDYSGTNTLEITGNESILRQLLLNLILNAAQAIKSKGKIELVCNRMDQHAIMEIHDSGSGIPPQDREKIFAPFYSTREEGTGLGLLSVKVYAEIHKGQVSVTDSYLGGACFRVEIPIDQERASLQTQSLENFF